MHIFKNLIIYYIPLKVNNKANTSIAYVSMLNDLKIIHINNFSTLLL